MTRAGDSPRACSQGGPTAWGRPCCVLPSCSRLLWGSWIFHGPGTSGRKLPRRRTRGTLEPVSILQRLHRGGGGCCDLRPRPPARRSTGALSGERCSSGPQTGQGGLALLRAPGSSPLLSRSLPSFPLAASAAAVIAEPRRSCPFRRRRRLRPWTAPDQRREGGESRPAGQGRFAAGLCVCVPRMAGQYCAPESVSSTEPQAPGPRPSGERASEPVQRDGDGSAWRPGASGEAEERDGPPPSLAQPRNGGRDRRCVRRRKTVGLGARGFGDARCPQEWMITGGGAEQTGGGLGGSGESQNGDTGALAE